MTRKQLQQFLDVEKWKASEAHGCDMCGRYARCRYCVRTEQYPCAAAHDRLIAATSGPVPDHVPEWLLPEPQIPLGSVTSATKKGSVRQVGTEQNAKTELTEAASSSENLSPSESPSLSESLSASESAKEFIPSQMQMASVAPDDADETPAKTMQEGGSADIAEEHEERTDASEENVPTGSEGAEEPLRVLARGRKGAIRLCALKKRVVTGRAEGSVQEN